VRNDTGNRREFFRRQPGIFIHFSREFFRIGRIEPASNHGRANHGDYRRIGWHKQGWRRNGLLSRSLNRKEIFAEQKSFRWVWKVCL